MSSTKKHKVLVELRPATEGFAGIPQETRLLFAGLRRIEGLEVEGLIQGPMRRLSKGTHKKLKNKWKGPIADLAKYSKVVVSVSQIPHRTFFEFIAEWLRTRIEALAMGTTSTLGIGKIVLTHFRSASFEDFIWRTFFSKSLPASDFELVTSANHRICSPSWDTMHRAGIKSLNFRSKPVYPRLDTEGIDIFIGQTPYPARLKKGTKFVIRYHDAIPVFMPHTINDKAHHQASHIYALKSNVESGAWFACVSEATRQDLLKMFPEVADRAVTIHNIVSHQYFDQETSFERVRGIIRSRIYGFDADAKDLGITPIFLNLREQERFFVKHLFEKQFNYLLVVSTVEPRKNHTRVLAAWEVIKEEIDPNLKLVIVGTLGWEYKSLIKVLKTWIDRGELFMLNAVPSPDLRVLYKHAAATVCPSLGEGFDFAGVEAMRSGGITVASDIPVHREIYENAAEYFNPYSTRSLVDCLKRVLYLPQAKGAQEGLRENGLRVSLRYAPETILPKWEQFLNSMIHNHA
jgi:glycosyltransferase involved in cell wall biosynthesis